MPIPSYSHYVLELVSTDASTGKTIHFGSLSELTAHLTRTYPAWAPVVARWFDCQIASGEINGYVLSIWRVEVDGEGYRVPIALFPPRPTAELARAIAALSEVRS